MPYLSNKIVLTNPQQTAIIRAYDSRNTQKNWFQ